MWVGVEFDEKPMTHEIVPGFDEESRYGLGIRLQRIAGEHDCLLLSLTGSVDYYSSPFLHGNVLRAIQSGFIRLIFDLSDVDYVASVAAATFLDLQRAVKEKGGDLTLCNMPPQVVKVFKLLSLDSIFRCTESVDAAIKLAAVNSPKPVFPKKLKCPACDKLLVASKSGKIRCPECKSIIVVEETGTIGLA